MDNETFSVNIRLEAFKEIMGEMSPFPDNIAELLGSESGTAHGHGYHYMRKMNLEQSQDRRRALSRDIMTA